MEAMPVGPGTSLLRKVMPTLPSTEGLVTRMLVDQLLPPSPEVV